MQKVKPIPQGMHSVTPHLVCAGAAKAIEFYKKAFGAEEGGRLPGPDGRLMHAAIRISKYCVGRPTEPDLCSASSRSRIVTKPSVQP